MTTTKRWGPANRIASIWPSLFMVLATACSAAGPSSPTGTAAGSATPVQTLDATPTRPPSAIVGEFDAGGAGWAMTKAGGALWIQVDAPVDAIVRIDATTGTSAPAVPLGWTPKSGTEGLWVVCCDWLVRVDPATGQEMLRVPMGGTLALGDDAAWLANETGLYRINADTGEVGEPIAPGVASACAKRHDLAIAFASAWLACTREGQVVRIDLATGEQTGIATAPGPNRLTVTEEAVWVTNYEAGSVSRIDPQTNGVTMVDGAGRDPGITNGGGYVWASTPTGIAKIDPTTASVIGEVDLGPGQYYELVWDDGIIWVSTRGNRVLKVDPSKATF